MTGSGLRQVPVGDLADATTASEVVVVGSGVAGLSAALGLAAAGRGVTLLTKVALGEDGSSRWAQGGVAVAVGKDDSAELHREDTVAAAAGLAVPEAVEILAGEGPARVRRLIELGARFDRDPAGDLALGREAAHRRRRILHAQGDATGAEMVRALGAAVRLASPIRVVEGAFALDLVTTGGRVAGVLARERDGAVVFHRAAAVILSTGGFGQLYARTTNPPEATGDGLAMAARAGAELADLEMVQFHPTALAPPALLETAAEVGAALPLVSEAVRGEGAVLVDSAGVRFMLGVDPRAELAPRDVVARAIRERQRAGLEVVLDARAAVGEAFPERFPTVFAHCRRAGLDPRREPIPVTPAAHYAMAGVAVDELGRASLPGLWACGEVASTGVHGANRLASNSLLEALVFGARVAEDVATAGPPALAAVSDEVVWREEGGGVEAGSEVAATIRRRMWESAGLVRDGRDLRGLLAELERLAATSASEPSPVRNLLTVGRLVAAAALAREESRGAHFRSDFPTPREEWRRRLRWTYRPAADLPLVSAAPRRAGREIA